MCGWFVGGSHWCVVDMSMVATGEWLIFGWYLLVCGCLWEIYSGVYLICGW